MKPTQPTGNSADRRRQVRLAPDDVIRVTRAVPVKPVRGGRVLNISAGGVAIETDEPVQIGERLSFHFEDDRPPVLAEVVGVDKADERYHVRCTCLLGGFAAS